MPEDKLRLNTKLFGGITGIIGRRDYFLNLVCISSISLLFIFPYFVFTPEKMINPNFIFNPNILFLDLHIAYKVLLIIGTIVGSLLMIPNLFRRMNDINGYYGIYMSGTCSILLFLSCFSFLYPAPYAFLYCLYISS